MSGVYIYALCDPESNEIRYVGKAVDLRKRLALHVCERTGTHKCKWVAKLAKRGLRPEIKELEFIPDAGDTGWQEKEIAWINRLRDFGCNLCNLLTGGIAGMSHSQETKNKISKSLKGKKFTEAHKEKIRQATIGRVPSESTIEKYRRLKHSDEAKAKIGMANRGRIMKPRSKEYIEKLRSSVRMYFIKRGPYKLSESHKAALRLGWANKKAKMTATLA